MTQQIISDIGIILQAMLGWFTSIFTFILATPILAIPFYITLVFMLIAFVFTFLWSLSHKNDTN